VAVYNPYAYEVHEDPYPVHRALRDEAALYRDEALGVWALSRHADVLEALGDTGRFDWYASIVDREDGSGR
jgi:cytochrome P450